MSKLTVGFLNWDRDVKHVKKQMGRIPHGSHIVVATNQADEWKKQKKIELIEAKPSVAASKNQILDAAIANGSEFCFIIEDDIKIADKSLFQKYLVLMDRLKIDLTFFGFDGANTVLLNKPNPCIIVRLNEQGEEQYFVRYSCSSLMCFRIKDDMVKFDERLCMLETEFLMADVTKNGGLPFSGFFPDIRESWKCVKRIDTPRVRVKNQELASRDVEVRGSGIKLENSAGEVLEYLHKTIQ